MLDQLRATCRQLLDAGTVRVVIGYGQNGRGDAAHPIFITDSSQVEQLTFNRHCHHNLVAYLKRPEVRALGTAAIVVKACDERALVVLEQESQIDRKQLVVLGVACDGTDSPQAAKCETCEVKAPRFADVVLGEPAAVEEIGPRYAELDQLLAMSPRERMDYWKQELARCTKCYACRQACPLCYCRRCIADKNRPVCIDTSATLKGNFAWQITRAFHLGGRCVGCDACAQACPAGINLRLLNQSLARASQDSFGYTPGQDPHAEPLIGSYRTQDHEAFIL